LKKRIITGIIGGAIFLSLVFAGGIGYAILLFLIAMIGFYEWIRMNHIHIWNIQSIIGFFFTALYFLPFSRVENHQYEWIVLELLSLLFVSVATKNKENVHQISYTLLGSIYIGTALHYMVMTRLLPNGLILTLAILIAIWTTDSAAYFVGRAIGRHKLWPTISPKKTIEGSMGACLFAVLFVVLLSLGTGKLPISYAAILALTISIVGQIGDLVESAVKRTLDVKDSGQVLPGHGGVLDRFDSMLFVFPVLHLLSLI
jgi:phosphatidate cytidylyltransferase